MKMSKKIIKIFLFYLVFIVLVNILFYLLLDLKFEPINELWNNGLIIKIKPLKYAMLFVHGYYDYDCYLNESFCKYYQHITKYDNNIIPTINLLNNLNDEGYKKIWGAGVILGIMII